MSNVSLANVADYADALLVARRAKNWLFVLIFAAIVIQAAVFLAYRYQLFNDSHALLPHYLVILSDVAGMVLPILLSLVLLLIVNVLLVGRLVGAGAVTGAFVWSLVLGLLLFPWQAVLNFGDMTSAEFRIPGSLYLWGELINHGRFDPVTWTERLLKWARFAGFPILSLLMLLVVQTKSSRGLKLAFGGQMTTPEPGAS